MPPRAQFDDTSLPLPICREVPTSFNGALQAGRTIGGAARRPELARKLAHHQRILRPHRTMIPRRRHQTFPNRSAPRTAREGYESGFRVSFVFRSNRHATLRNSEIACDSLPVGQVPRLHAPNRDSEAHSWSRVGKIPVKSGRCTFVPIEITKRKPGRMARGAVESAESRFKCGNTRMVEGSGSERQVREDPSHRRFVHQSFHDAMDRPPRHQKLKDNW